MTAAPRTLRRHGVAALAATVREVVDSRVYAGVHDPLDNTVGMEIGRRVARVAVPAVASERDPAAPLTRAAAR